MSQTGTINQNAGVDRNAIVNTLDEIIRSFDDIEKNGSDMEAEIGLENGNCSDDEQHAENHRVLDLVEEYTGHTNDILRDLKALRKALPATYFKNRSKIRDTFERLEQSSSKCRDNAYAIIDALQSRQANPGTATNVAAGIELIRTKLTSLLQTLESSASDRL
jgi:hypothetical protein